LYNFIIAFGHGLTETGDPTVAFGYELIKITPESVNKYSKNTNFPIEIKHLAYM